MATHTTRFEGSVNVRNTTEMARVVPLLSDNQLSFFFKMTKAGVDTIFPLDTAKLAIAHKLVKDEMAARVLETLADETLVASLGYAAAAQALREGAVS